MEQVTQQPPLQGRRLLWLIPLPAKKPKQPKAPKATKIAKARPTNTDTFYSRAMEWTHRADKVISLALGYLLAIASVLGFMDVLSNGQVLSAVPWAFYLWLLIMGLGVDFQLLLVIGRFPDLIQAVESWALKLIFILFNLGFLGFLAYMSATIAAVFTQHVDMHTGTVTDAMTALHIDAHTFVFQRAWLATLLLILMAVDRTLERWRMRQTASSQSTNEVSSLQGSDLAEALKQIAEMNAQNLQAMQAMQQQQMQVTIEQATRVTVEAVKESLLQALPSTQRLQIPAPPSENATLAFSNPTVPPFMRDYRAEIEQLIAVDPQITLEEVMLQTGCSEPTAKKWLGKLRENA